MSRVAVVTGGNKGVGFGIVRALCKKFDGDVILTSRNESLGKEAIQALEKEGLNPKYHQLDITDPDSIVRIRDFLKEKYGGIDVLVNNAGIAFKQSDTAPFSEQAEVTIKTNYTGTLDASNILFPILKPHARVSNVSSMVCQFSLPKCSKAMQEKFTSPDLTMDELSALMKDFVSSAQTGEHKNKGFADSAYGMSKIGVTAMTMIQQREMDKQGGKEKDIVINACCPGYVDTDMTSHKGPLTIDQGAVTPVYCALLPPNIDSPRGKFLREEKVAEFKPSE